MWKGQQEIISQHAPGAGDKLEDTVRATAAAAHSLARLTTLIKLSCCFLAFSAAAHTHSARGFLGWCAVGSRRFHLSQY